MIALDSTVATLPFVFDQPFPHLLWIDAVSSSELRAVSLGLRNDWALEQDSFYEHWAHVVEQPGPTRSFDPGIVPVAQRFRHAMQDCFGAELASDSQVVAHRMLPGQLIGPHNDAPRLGYESFRVVLYLDAIATDGQGVLSLHSNAQNGQAVREIRPAAGLAFGFPMSRSSIHSVSELTSDSRDTLVFNFWHAGNSPATERGVLAVDADLDHAPAFLRSLRLLPELARGADERESIRVGLVGAMMLHRWGFPDEISLGAALVGVGSELRILAEGLAPTGLSIYRRCRVLHSTIEHDEETVRPLHDELSRSIVLALWIGRLLHRVFDPSRWRRVGAMLGPAAFECGDAERLRALLFPTSARP